MSGMSAPSVLIMSFASRDGEGKKGQGGTQQNWFLVFKDWVHFKNVGSFDVLDQSQTGNLFKSLSVSIIYYLSVISLVELDQKEDHTFPQHSGYFISKYIFKS